MRPVLRAVVPVFLLAAGAAAQFDNQWVEFVEDPSRLDVGETISSNLFETDLDWADLDKDGWIDLVVVRKKPFTTFTKRKNMLLMNEDGVLTDRTLQYATASSVFETTGDKGFDTPTNDRDVQITDVDGDSWLDVVTAPTLADADPKWWAHPRIYMNLANDGGGNWQGIRYEEERIPQIYHAVSGAPTNPRFCGVSAGDVTGDGFVDLYFSDYDSGGGTPQNDVNDRLFVNDGNGFFSDESFLRMTSTMLESAFGMATEIADFNGDGALDVLRDTALNPPQHVSISYNDPDNVGIFNLFDPFHTFAPYHTNIGDLNNDGKIDVVITDDGDDRFRVNTGNDALGRVVWSTPQKFEFLVGGDDGFGGNNLIADLDMDGWNDIIITDIDVDIFGYDRRTHIYHNLGGAVGGIPTLREERASDGSWVGVVGMTSGKLGATHDVAVFDIDNDGDNDMILSRKDGTDVWMSEAGAGEVCQTDLGFGGPGAMQLDVCGADLTTVGSLATFSLTGGPPSTQAFVPIGVANDPTPFKGGTLVPVPWLVLLDSFATDANGDFEFTIPGMPGTPVSLFMQVIAKNASDEFELSNAVEVVLGV